MFERDRHQGLDELAEDDLARHGLRSFDHRAYIELRDRRPEGGGGWRGKGLLAQERVRLLELPDLTIGTPSEVAVPCVTKIGVGDRLEAARRVEPRAQFVSKALVLDE